MTNQTEYNQTMLALCPLYSPFEEKMVEMAAFWVDGVAKTFLAAIGIISNITAGYILNRPKMKNSFNLCLVALAWIDTIYLIVSMVESIKRRYSACQNHSVNDVISLWKIANYHEMTSFGERLWYSGNL